jgi:hypothetical protein
MVGILLAAFSFILDRDALTRRAPAEKSAFRQKRTLISGSLSISPVQNASGQTVYISSFKFSGELVPVPLT